jgi:mRNA interferase MazF
METFGPALVLSPETYNRKVGLALLCPITSQVKGYPFEVLLPDDQPVRGVILSDQVKNLDWRARSAEFACQVSQAILAETLQKLHALLQI